VRRNTEKREDAIHVVAVQSEKDNVTHAAGRAIEVVCCPAEAVNSETL